MEWAYVAGYFDGEGNVGFSRQARGDRTRMMSWFNTHLASLEAMRAFIGVGQIHERSKPSGFAGKKPAYQLYVSNKAAMLHVIDNMLPHLIIKREQAEALRTYLIDHVDETRAANHGKVAAVSKEQLQSWHESGESLGDIAQRLGVGHVSVLNMFRIRGIKTRDQATAASLKHKGVPKSVETRARMKAAQRASWADPVYRAKQAALRNSPEKKESMRAAQLAKWADPEYRARMKAVRQAQWAKPENRAAMSVAQRARRAKEKAKAE